MKPLALPWPHAAFSPVIHSLAFDVQAFDAGFFAEYGIDFPAPVARAVRKRQAEYFYGRLCARAALMALDRVAPVASGAMREPLWPEGVVGSITHSRTVAAAVALPAAACRGIGIDIEELATPDSWQALRDLVLNPAEYALLEAQAQRLDLATLLTLVFSAKESFYKATYTTVGHYFDFNALTLQAIDTGRCELSFVVESTLCAEWRRGQQLRIGYALGDVLGHSGCVATLFAW